MASHRPTKKPKIVLDAKPAPVSSSCAVGIHLSPELVARIATYVDITNSEVMNICLAVGPVAARPIRNCYLKKNVKYLNTTLKQLLRVRRRDEAWLELPMLPCRDKAGANHREWMEVNTDWKTIAISNEEIENHENIQVKDAIESGDHPFVAFNNAAFAIELGLIEVVKFLIEDKGVDPNTYGWTMSQERRGLHLLAIAMYANRCDIFQYLVSLPSIDLWSKSSESNVGIHPDFLFDIASDFFCRKGRNTCSGRNFINGFLTQPDFDVNFQPFFDEGRGLPCLYICLDLFTYCLYTSTENGGLSAKDARRIDRHLELIKMLLDAGADVRRSYTGAGTAIEYLHSLEKSLTRHSSRPWNSQKVNEALQMMERATGNGQESAD